MLEDQDHPAFVSFFFDQAGQDRRRWFKMMPQAAYAPAWGAKAWEEVGRELFLRSHLSGLGTLSPFQIMQDRVNTLLLVLAEADAIIDAHRFDAHRLESYAKEFFAAMESEPEAGDEWAAVVSDEALQEMRRVLFALGEHILGCVSPFNAISREGVERRLRENDELLIAGPLTRYLAHLANRARPLPSVLVLPNQRQNDNPFFAVVSGTRRLPTRVLRLLRLFDR